MSRVKINGQGWNRGEKDRGSQEAQTGLQSYLYSFLVNAQNNECRYSVSMHACYCTLLISTLSAASCPPPISIDVFLKKIHFGDYRLEWERRTSGARYKHSSRDIAARQSQGKGRGHVRPRCSFAFC